MYFLIIIYLGSYENVLVWVSEDILRELVLFLYHMSPGNRVCVDILALTGSEL